MATSWGLKGKLGWQGSKMVGFCWSLNLWAKPNVSLVINPQTKKIEELQWAQILVKTNSEVLPSALEIEVEEVCYSLSLWWEIR